MVYRKSETAEIVYWRKYNIPRCKLNKPLFQFNFEKEAILYRYDSPDIIKKEARWQCHRASRKAAATYSPTWCSSTIGASELNFSVRDGKRWTLTAITAAVFYLREIHSDYQSWLQKRFRAISTGRLKTLLLLHLLPINVVVSHDPMISHVSRAW